jgi:hypothetical protein
VLAAFIRQRVIVAGGLAVFSIVVGLGLVAPNGSAEATAALVVGAPLVVFVTAALWADAQAELLRAESTMQSLRRSINARFPLDPPPLRSKAYGASIETTRTMLLSYQITAAALLAVALASAIYGIAERHPKTVGGVLLGLVAALILASSGGVLTTVALRLRRVLQGLHLDEMIGTAVKPIKSSDAAGTLVGREEFLREQPAYTPEELFGDAGEDAEERAYRMLFDRRLFALERAGDLVFPAFQFDAHRETRPVIGAVLRVLGEANPLGRWELAVWFTTPNAYLHGRPPIELLDADAERVVEAAREEFGPVVS